MLILIIAGGPDKGRTYELHDGQPVILGREGDQIPLNDRKASREHARLWSEGGQWYLEDLDSRHGTYRNHAKLEENQKARLKDGDYVQVGNTVMVMGRLHAGPAEHASPAAGVSKPASDRRSKVLAAAGLTASAAMLGLGVYLVSELQDLKSQTVSVEDYAALKQEMLESQKATSQEARDLQAALSSRAASDRRLKNEQERLISAMADTGETINRHNESVASAADEIRAATNPITQGLAEIQKANEQQRLAFTQLSDTLAAQNAEEDRAAVMAQLDAIKTQLAGQPSVNALIEQLESAIAVNAEATGQAVQRAIDESLNSDAQLAATERSEAMMQRVLNELDKLPSADEIARDVRVALNEGQAVNEEFMRQVLVELQRTGQQISTDVAAAMNEDAGYAQALLTQVMEELAKQPDGEQLAAQLKLAMNEAVAGQSGSQAQIKELMQQVLVKLEQRPASEQQIVEELRTAIGKDAQRTEQLLAQMLDELNNRPSAQQIADELRSVDNEAAARTASLLEQVLERIDNQQALADQIDELRKTLISQPQADARLSQQVMNRLDEQAENNDQIVAAIAQLREAMPEDVTGQLDQVLARLDQQVREEQLNAAVETAVARVAAAEDQAVLTAIDSLSQRIAALPSTKQLEEVLDSQSELAKLLDSTDARAAISELRAALDRVAQARPAGDADPQLNQIIEMLKKREQADLMLAEMHDMMQQQPQEAERMRRQVLAAIQEAGEGDTDRLLQQLLDEVRTRMANDEAIRQAVQTALNGSVLPNQKAWQDSREVESGPNRVAASDDNADSSNTNVRNAPAEQPPVRVTTVNNSQLTKVEQAYKQAFDSGKPVIIGAGTVDPTTGKVSEGQLIDPSVAKALGFVNWRDWYLADDHAKRRRLQRQAQEQRNAADRNTPPDFIALPSPNEKDE